MNFFETTLRRRILFGCLYLSEGAPIGFLWSGAANPLACERRSDRADHLADCNARSALDVQVRLGAASRFTKVAMVDTAALDYRRADDHGINAHTIDLA